MQFTLSTFKKFAAAGLAVAALGGASVAQARDNIHWSVGINALPGVAVGVSNGHHYGYAQPQPYYVQPAQPVYVPQIYPNSYYVQPAPVYYSPPPVYYRPAPVYFTGSYYSGHGRHWNNGHRGHGRHDGHRDHHDGHRGNHDGHRR